MKYPLEKLGSPKGRQFSGNTLKDVFHVYLFFFVPVSLQMALSPIKVELDNYQQSR